ncbi:MAG: hypothetical protein QNJ65_12590 [Xenococcaceae cyanobacterium MO_234.B1]|nr:hypothetical protein [Xenococcaceae cyanobacterium MO_234.B1]
MRLKFDEKKEDSEAKKLESSEQYAYFSLFEPFRTQKQPTGKLYHQNCNIPLVIVIKKSAANSEILLMP